MKHGSNQPDFLLTSPQFRETDRNLHPLCPSPDCVSANIPPPQLPSSPKEGFSSILNFWSTMEQTSGLSASATVMRCNPPLANAFSRNRGDVNQPSSGTTSDMDSISNSNSSRPQHNGHFKALESSGLSVHSEGSSDIDNLSAAYEIVAPKSSHTPRPLPPQPKTFRPLVGSPFGEYVNILKNGSSESRPILLEREESPPILPPKSPYLNRGSRNDEIPVNGYQTMPRRNGTLPKPIESKLPPSPARTLAGNGTANLTNNTKPIVNNGTNYNLNRLSPNFRYSFHRLPEIPPKGNSERSISLYGADREFQSGMPSRTTASRPVSAMNSTVGMFRVRYPTMSTTHTPTNVSIAKTKTNDSATRSFSQTPTPRRSSTPRVVEVNFCHGRLNGSSVRTNGYANISSNFYQGCRPKVSSNILIY